MEFSLDQFDGILSLLAACLELVLVMNLLIFAEKNSINNNIVLLVALLCIYQLFEFAICYFGISSPVVLYIALFTFTLVPPLSLKIAAGLHGYRGRIVNIVYLPALFFIFYFPSSMELIEWSNCSIITAEIQYPLGVIYGIFYYLPILVSTWLFYQLFNKSEGKAKTLYLILLIGYTSALVPSIILTLTTNLSESIGSKLAFLTALSLTYFAIMNKEEKKEEQ